MDFIEGAVGFGVFIAVAVAMSFGLEALMPGTTTNPFVGAAVGAVAGWLVAKAIGDH